MRLRGCTLDPAEYALARGWDYSCIVATAVHGVSEADYPGLAEAGLPPAEMLAYCRDRVIMHVTAIYDRACGSWTGADWCHERREGGRVVYDRHCIHHDHGCDGVCDHEHDRVDCAGGQPGCDVCDDAAHEAEVAESEADVAMTCLQAWDLDGAQEHAEVASRIEREYGDDPTWRSLLQAMEELS